MTAEIKYTPRFLKLDVNSSLEESKLAYAEMAPCWEKVNMHGSYWGQCGRVVRVGLRSGAVPWLGQV